MANSNSIDLAVQKAWGAHSFISREEVSTLLTAETSLSRLEITSILKSRGITLIESHSDLIEKEASLYQKIVSKLVGAEFHVITDEQRWNAAAKYFDAYQNRSFHFENCSEIKQVERLEELTEIFSELHVLSSEQHS
jgi:hypothetical protein